MKCENCGAQIGLDVEKCPYCGTINQIAVVREEKLEDLKERNEEFEKKVLKDSKEELRYRLHKRINLALFLALAFLVIVGSIIEEREQNYVSEENDRLVREYYEAGKLEELYYHMHENNIIGMEGYYDYSNIVLLWNAYQDCQIEFACAYDDYLKNGKYSTWQLESCVDKGYDVLTGYISYTYDENMSEQNKELIKPYQENVYMLFTGALQIPEEMLVDLEPYDYERQEALKEYVLEVLPNE